MGSMPHNLAGCKLSPAPESCPQGYFLVGPTASGKTDVAHVIARATGAAILSADSMLVYHGMDIGTAKPSPEEREGIVYFGLDVAHVSQSFSVAQFLECARQAWRCCQARQCPLLVVGGTGLYVKCLTEGLDAAPAGNAELRSRAEGILNAEGVHGLFKALEKADPARASRIRDRSNPRRLIRALELAWQKVPPSAGWSSKPATPLIGLRLEPQHLASRIAERVTRMYARGLLEEVRQLLQAGPMSRTAQQAIGYAEAAAVLRGEMTQDEAMAMTIRRTRLLAKRQMTWFRHQANVHWVDVEQTDTLDEVAARVVAAWDKYGRVDLHI